MNSIYASVVNEKLVVCISFIIVDVVITPGIKGSNSTVEIVTDTASLKMYQLRNPDVGLWHVQVTASSTYDVSVKATSMIDFAYRFVEETDIGHGGYNELEGKPLAGMLNTCSVFISFNNKFEHCQRVTPKRSRARSVRVSLSHISQ